MEIDNDNIDLQLLTYRQLQPVTETVYELIDSLPPKALQQLLGAYEGDVGELLDELLRQTHYVMHHNASKIDSEKLGYNLELESAFDNILKKKSLNYFAATVPTNFTHGWRTLEWGNMLQLYPWSSYLCQRGSGKSLRIRELVVMADGTYKEIQHIKVGDKVMGIDSTPRTVLSTHRGIDDMYEIEQANAESYVTNSEHILHFKRGDYVSYRDKFGTTRWKMIFDEDHTQIVEMPTKEFHNKSRLYKSQSFGYRVKGWDLPEKELKIEPYFLGLWLGDGHSTDPIITNIDQEIIEYIYSYAKKLNGEVKISKDKYSFRIIFSKDFKGNFLRRLLKEYNLLKNKHIPEDYLLGSRQQRLELLAGLIDSDGTTSTRNTSYSIAQKNKELLEQIQRLCWSLGFRANLKERKKKLKYKNNEVYISYELHFSGDVWDIPCKIKRKKIEKYDRVQDSQRSKLNTKLLGKGEYCGFECDGDKLFLLKDGTVVHNSYFFCYVVPLWRLYTYDPPSITQQSSIDNQNRKETAIITNESRLGRLHISKITEEINRNSILYEKLAKRTGQLGKDGITTDTGSILHLRTFGSQIRGLHIGMSITDDFLSKAAMYSKDQREKFHEVFYAEIMNIVEPQGYNIVSGTPFHQFDLYGDLKNDDKFKVFEYPGIFPDGQLLAPDRFTFQHLMEIKRSLGSIVFSREILVSPISDDSTIFPWEFLNRSFIGMENISLVNNVSSYPIKLKSVIIGCDFAKSATVGADYTVYTVWGSDFNNNYYLLHIWRKKGASLNEQVSKIVQLDRDFRPNKIVCEANGFQSNIAELVRQRGLKNVEDFTTTASKKKDEYEGLASLSAFFERGEIRLPYKEDTRDLVMEFCNELNSIGYNEDKGTLESIGGHDDISMSAWIALYYLIENKVSPKIYMV